MKSLITILAVVLYSSTTVFAQADSSKVKPPNGLSEIEAYSLFYSDYKNDSYQPALDYGRWILKGMPRSIQGYAQFDLATNLDRLITIYTKLGQQSNDPTLKSAYIDTANSIFDKAFKTFSKDEIDYYQWHLNRGRLYQENADFMSDAKNKATAEYEKAFALKPEEMTKTGDGYYIKVLLQNLVAEDTKDSKQEALAVIKKADDGSVNSDLSDYFDKIRNKLFDSPKERMGFLEKKVSENPNDQASIRQLRDIYQQQDMIDKAQQMNQKLYKADPSYANTTALANFAIQNANYKDAVNYLNEAKDKTKDPEKREKIYQSLAQAYLNMGSLQSARDNARQAIKATPKDGKPYMIMADIYARAVNDCTSGRELTRNDRAVYWLVIDYLNKAKSVDSSISAQANNRLQSYRPVAPTKEDVFMSDKWKKGQSIRIDSSLNSCYAWINESTTVR